MVERGRRVVVGAGGGNCARGDLMVAVAVVLDMLLVVMRQACRVMERESMSGS